MSAGSNIIGALQQLWGLFVEDGTFTIGLVLSAAFAIWVLPRLPVQDAWRGPLLFVVLAVVLLENVRRSARK